MEVETTPINIVTNGTTIKGDITASGDFRLDGTLEGNIQRSTASSSSATPASSRATSSARTPTS